jgi:hypothetical protein
MNKTAGYASISLIENHLPTAGLANYKGVMLCNRPFAGSAGQFTGTIFYTSVLIHILVTLNKTTSNAEKTSFSCGKVSEPLGTGASQIPAILSMTVSFNCP